MAVVMTIDGSRHLPGSLESGRNIEMAIKKEEEDHETIHSGHFMLSRVHDPSPEDDDDDELSTQSVEKTSAYDFTTSKKEPSSTYEFKPSQTIDSSLSKLFECLTLAYSGKLVSPKWKAFRGLHMSIKEKVRLNNIIWREWHMQYIYGKRGVICQFASPLADDVHTKPEAVVLEGKYWKRRLDTVTNEYKRWRKFHKNRISQHGQIKPDSSMSEILSHSALLDRLKNVQPTSQNFQQTSATDLNITNDLMDIDFTQDFFTNFNQPFAFPTAREFSGFGVSDLTQPGLLSLQPSLEDFPMDTFDLQEMIQFSQSQAPNISNSVVQFTGSNEPQTVKFQLQPDIEMKSDTGQGQISNQGQLNLVSLLLAGDANNFQSQMQVNNTQTVLNQLLQQQGQQFQQETTSQNSLVVDNISGINKMAVGNQAKDATLSSLHAVLTGSSTTDTNTPAKPAVSQSSNKMGGVAQKRQAKKDGFVVPVGKPAATRSKTRTIAPAPSVQKTAYSALEELLKTGTYPGAVISVKNGGGKSTATIVTSSTSVVPIKPALPNNSASSPSLLNTSNTGAKKSNLQKVKTDSVLLTQKVGTKEEKDTPMFTSYSTPTLNVGLAAEQSLSPLSSGGSPLGLTHIESPLDSSIGSPGGKDREDKHRSSEQKRRFNIKHGFDTLHVLIPAIMQNSNAKISKAAMLQKTAEYCKKLKQERAQMQNEADILKNEIETLNQAIGQCQAQLPATGVPVTRQRADQLKKLFEEYVKNRTLQNWKFWIFSKIIAHLFDTFNGMVSTTSMEELCRTTLSWLDQHCSLVNLRPDVTNALTSLSTTTSILSDPTKLPEQATSAVLNPKPEPS